MKEAGEIGRCRWIVHVLKTSPAPRLCTVHSCSRHHTNSFIPTLHIVPDFGDTPTVLSFLRCASYPHGRHAHTSTSRHIRAHIRTHVHARTYTHARTGKHTHTPRHTHAHHVHADTRVRVHTPRPLEFFRCASRPHVAGTARVLPFLRCASHSCWTHHTDSSIPTLCTAWEQTKPSGVST